MTYKIPQQATSFGAPSRVYTPDSKGEFTPLTAADELAMQQAANGPSQSLREDTSRNITATDNGKTLVCTTAITFTIPASLLPRPDFVVIPPASGNASIAVSGGAQINGATSTLTRSRASNPAGIVVIAYVESDAYGVSGS